MRPSDLPEHGRRLSHGTPVDHRGRARRSARPLRRHAQGARGHARIRGRARAFGHPARDHGARAERHARLIRRQPLPPPGARERQDHLERPGRGDPRPDLSRRSDKPDPVGARPSQPRPAQCGERGLAELPGGGPAGRGAVRERPEIVFTPRTMPVTHRHYDITATRRAFPTFRFTAHADAIARVHRAEGL